MTRHICTATLSIVLAGALLAPKAQACDCSQPGPPCAATEKTPVVFAGRVTQISDIFIPKGTGNDRYSYPYRVVRFDVEEHFRGPQRKSIEVTTGMGGGDCGFSFRVGERYVVYAGDAPSLGRLYTGICTRTGPVSEAAADLDFLRRLGDPSRGAGVEGTITELVRNPKTNDVTTRGLMRGVRVVVTGSGKRWDATTDEQGWFRVWGLPPGEYSVRPVLPKHFVQEATTQKVRISTEACGWVYMLATPYPFPQPPGRRE